MVGENMMVGTLPGVQGLVEPAIVLYGWRLNRTFGPQRVGWCLVAAFSCLALVHLANPSYTGGTFSDLAPMLIGFLLLLAMAHVDVFLGTTSAASSERAALRARLKSEGEKREQLAEAYGKLLADLEAGRRECGLLENSERQYRTLFANSPLPMWIYDLRSFEFLAVNDAALKLLHLPREKFMRLNAREIRPPGDIPAFLKHSELANPPARSQVVWRYLTGDKQVLHCHVHCLDLPFDQRRARLVYAEDVTAARLREIEGRHAVKMEAASDLAAGVAHHFNNSLTPVLGYTSLLKKRVEDPELAKQLRQISDSATRIANLTSQLMVFGRGKPPEFVVLELNAWLTEAMPMLRRLIGSSFELKFGGSQNLRTCSADPDMLIQALVHLVLNARDAMPFGGDISITTGGTEIRGATGDICQAVFLSVADSGTGVPEDFGNRIFEPFFSTHDVGVHTGLGLAQTYSLVKQHHGTIDYKPRPQGGTTFTITLPCTQPDRNPN